MTSAFSPQDALLAAMILTAAADGEMTETERRAIDDAVNRLPAFEGFAHERLGDLTAVVVETLGAENGVEQAIRLVAEASPGPLRETAYALCCEVAAADGTVALEEVRLLELIRHGLDIDRLTAAALERCVRARYAKG
jgi:tellurite resistance protein